MYICISMNRDQTWYKNLFFFKKLSILGGVFQPSSTSTTDLTNVLNWCICCICWIETIWSLKINNIMSGEHAKVEKKKKHVLALKLSAYQYIYIYI